MSRDTKAPPISLLDRLRYSPYLVQLVVTRRCNLACGYCTEYDTSSKPVPTEILKARIDHITALGAWALEFTGGEPMLHPDICELIRYARSRGIFKVMMISNAYLFNEEVVQKLNDAGLMELQISIDGVEPNETTIKVLRPLRRKLEAVAKVAKFKVVLSSVLGSSNVDETLEVIGFAKQNGFRPRCLILHDGHGQLELGPEQLGLYARVQEAMGERFSEAGDYRTRLIKTGQAPFKCRAGARYIYVDEFGNACWCSQTRDIWKKPILDYTPEDLKTQFHTQKSCAKTCTIGCARTCSAYDEWRGQNGAHV